GAPVRGPRAGRRRGREAVRRAGARRPRAALRDVALTGRFAAGGGRWLEAVHALPGAVAGVRPVAGAAVRGPRAGRRRGREAVWRAGVRRPRAALGDVALTCRCAADGGRRLLLIRTARVCPVALILYVADPHLIAAYRSGITRREDTRSHQVRRGATHFAGVVR